MRYWYTLLKQIHIQSLVTDSTREIWRVCPLSWNGRRPFKSWKGHLFHDLDAFLHLDVTVFPQLFWHLYPDEICIQTRHLATCTHKYHIGTSMCSISTIHLFPKMSRLTFPNIQFVRRLSLSLLWHILHIKDGHQASGSKKNAVMQEEEEDKKVGQWCDPRWNFWALITASSAQKRWALCVLFSSSLFETKFDTKYVLIYHLVFWREICGSWHAPVTFWAE